MNIIQVYKRFPTQEDCITHLEKVRWGGKPKCPYCKSVRVSKNEHRYHCNACNTSFSVTVGTIFHKTKLDLQKWFLAISLVLNAKKGISARQLARDIEVNKNTAWRILMQIRKAMHEYGDLLEGIIEADETYIGGKNKNKHWDDKDKGSQGRNNKSKTPVIGVIQRGGKVRAQKARNVTARTLQSFIRANAKRGSHIMTDEWLAYKGLDRQNYKHSFIKHGQGQYANGIVYTNTMENFWALLKRGIFGQYHHLTDKHLQMYINEFCYRFNNRANKDVFDEVILQAVTI